MRPLLIVAAPIKRPYIWDLTPQVSAVRYCLRHGLRVYLLEWLPPSRGDGFGLDAYADRAISECVSFISSEPPATQPFLMGHSLGGTFAAIFAALEPKGARGLVLLGAPLSFEPTTSRFRDAVVAMAPASLSPADPVPGSVVSQFSALASPGTFIWSRLADAALSMADPVAMDIHARVERWALDEVALPGRLVDEIVQWLYRENRFCRGLLPVRNRLVGPASVQAPTLAIVGTSDEIAPAASVAPFLEATATTDVRLLECPAEIGVGLQHLAILAGRQANARVWPEIIAWLDARR